MDAQSNVMAQRQQEAGRILARLREVLPAVLARYPVDVAYVYGSVARGTVTPFSDVDVALLLTTPLPPYERLQLELTIQGEIEAASGLSPVDVRAINQAPLMVRGRIVQEGVLLYERDRARRVAFEVATRKRYFDFAPAARRLRDAFLQHIRREGLLHGQLGRRRRDNVPHFAGEPGRF
jgi:predicted nucleotidyltransferase